MFAVDERHIVEWVEEGVLTVIEDRATEWRFSGAALRRARIALRLERDLGINLAGRGARTGSCWKNWSNCAACSRSNAA